MYNNGMPRQGGQQQNLYSGARGYGSMPGQYQAGYTGFNNAGFGQQQGANNMAAYQQQQQPQQFQPGYSQQHPGYPQQQQQWYPSGQGYDQASWGQ